MKVEDWVELEEHKCLCRGLGWAEAERDKYVECPIHYEGQLHPDSMALLLDEPDRMTAEERKAKLNYQIREAKSKIISLQEQLRAEQYKLVQFELELINRTPTVKSMQAVVPEEAMPDSELEISDEDFLFLDGDNP